MSLPGNLALCPGCQKFVPIGWPYCAGCGARLRVPATTAPRDAEAPRPWPARRDDGAPETCLRCRKRPTESGVMLAVWCKTCCGQDTTQEAWRTDFQAWCDHHKVKFTAADLAAEAEALRGQVAVAIQAGRHDVLRFLVEQRKLVPMAAFDKRRGDSVYNWHTDAIERVGHWLGCVEERDSSIASASTAPAWGPREACAEIAASGCNDGCDCCRHAAALAIRALGGSTSTAHAREAT